MSFLQLIGGKMPFTKLDDGLVFSSLMAEDDSVFKVWIIILSLTKQDGICPISAAFLERITAKDAAEIERCLRVLESPDKRSRTQEHDGKRLKRVDGGFFVLNYHKYRGISLQDYEREKKTKYRRNKSQKAIVHGQSGTVHGPSASASASTSSSASVAVSEIQDSGSAVVEQWESSGSAVSQKERKNRTERKEQAPDVFPSQQKKKPRQPFVPPSVEQVKNYCAERRNSVNPQSFVDFYISKDWMIGKNKMVDWRAAVRTWENSRQSTTNQQESRSSGLKTVSQMRAEGELP